MMLAWLQGWYAGYCDGEWEHQYGIRIETLDNPGWLLHIDLNGTDLEGVEFAELVRQNPANVDDWVQCRVGDEVFTGAGGSHNLEELLRVFRTWVEGRGSRD
jgi:hypothetical protein